MKYHALAVFVLSLSIPAALSAQTDGGNWRKQAAKYGWMLDYRSAKTLAAKTGKPMMVVFRCIP